MTKIVFLPHEEICPEGAVIEAKKGESICRAALRNDIHIEHACEMSCACTTCHVIIREGYHSLDDAGSPFGCPGIRRVTMWTWKAFQRFGDVEG